MEVNKPNLLTKNNIHKNNNPPPTAPTRAEPGPTELQLVC